MVDVFINDPGLYFFQVLRGLLWVGLAVLVIRSMKENTWKIALFVAVLFAILMNDSLFMPNPLMPDAIRWTHFIETASSNFIWGWTIIAVLLWRPKQSEQYVAEQ
jgi:hypothetical protein